MTLVSAFVAAFFVVLIIGGVAFFFASRLYPTSSPRVAAFALTIGFAIARYSEEGITFADGFVAVGRVAGAIVGLLALWYLLFQRKVGQNG